MDQEIDEIMADVDLKGNGQIDFSEWLAATTKPEFIINEEKLKQAFKYFNKSSTGKISLDEVKEVMGGSGCAGPEDEGEGEENMALDDQVYQDIMAEVGPNCE